MAACIGIGCQASLAHAPLQRKPESMIREAEGAAMNGEFFRERRLLESVLTEDPENIEAQKLMGDVLDKEIATQKEVFEDRPIEEYTPAQRSLEAKTWLERAEVLYQLREYDQALMAAEEVFVYDADSIRASELIDSIRKTAMADGKADSRFLKTMYSQETEERIRNYKEQAKLWIEKGRWGAARLAVEKTLLLAPEDREAQALYDKIRAQSEVSPP